MSNSGGYGGGGLRCGIGGGGRRDRGYGGGGRDYRGIFPHARLGPGISGWRRVVEQSRYSPMLVWPSPPPPCLEGEEQMYVPNSAQLQKQPIWTINVEKGRKAYRYNVDIERQPMRKPNGQMDNGKSLVRAGDDGMRALNRNLCAELITIAFRKTRRFGMPNGNEIIYDYKTCLYASCPIQQYWDIFIENKDVNNYVKVYCGEGSEVRFRVKITRNKACPELILDEFKQYRTSDSVFLEDRTLCTFFEMATSQYALNRGRYVSIEANQLIELDDPKNKDAFREKVDNGMFLRAGFTKSIQVIRNYGKTPKAAVVLNNKVAAFFETKPLIDTVMDILPQRHPAKRLPAMNDYGNGDWAIVERIIKDVRVEVTYNRTRTFGLGRLTDNPIRDIYVEVDRENATPQRMSIPEYYQWRWNIELRYLDMPGIMTNIASIQSISTKKVELFPLEVLEVMEDQRVPREKMDQRLAKKLLQHNSVGPAERMSKMLERAKHLALFSEQNIVLRAFGLSVDPAFNQGEVPNELNNWLVLYEESIENKFVDSLFWMSRERGIPMTDPHMVPFDSYYYENSDRDWAKMFEQCVANHSVQFIMLIDYKREDTHGLLKLYEALTKVKTQYVTIEQASDVVNNDRHQTLQNIFNKLTIKNFGLNYQPEVELSGHRFDLASGDVLVIGYDMVHPAPMPAVIRRQLAAQGESELSSLEPSCVGICANIAQNPYNFIGDYFFQETRHEALDQAQLTHRMKWILRTLEKHRPTNYRPKYIVIFRGSPSEGQFALSCKKELIALKDGCVEHDPKYDPKFVMVEGRHCKKKKDHFFIEKDGRAYNLLVPGSVIQEKETGKPVQYAILEDEIGICMDELQSLIMTLSYSHHQQQIVNMEASMPEPMYQAEELASRGMNNFRALKRFKSELVPMRERPVARRDALQQTISLVDNQTLTNMLSYWDDSPSVLLSLSRFTAYKVRKQRFNKKEKK